MKVKKYITALLALLSLLVLTACGKDAAPAESSSPESETAPAAASKSEVQKEPGEDIMTENQIYITVGENILTVILEDNESVKALKELLADGALTIKASNYGGFEKVCALGTELPRNDSQTTTQAGDVCLYSGDQIVIFHGSNSWAYTRLGKVTGRSTQELLEILSGEETEITLSLDRMDD